MRNIFIVNATQCVISPAHPEGLYSTVTDYPKTFDSRSYPAADGNPNGDTDKALAAARAEYYSRLSAFYAGSESRTMWAASITQADGRIVEQKSVGAFPDMTPAPEPEGE